MSKPRRDDEVEQPLPDRLNSVSLLFPDAYLRAEDLHGRDVHLTIDRVVLRTMLTDGGQEKRPVIHFRELDELPKDERKVFVLNKTNAKSIVKALGERDPRKWGGRRITLFATECQAFGETVDCIRVRPKEPPAPRTAPPAQPSTPARAANPNPDVTYIKGVADRQLVSATRRRLFGDADPLNADQIKRLADELRRTETKPADTEANRGPSGTISGQAGTKPADPAPNDPNDFFPDEPAAVGQAAAPSTPTHSAGSETADAPTSGQQPGGFFDLD